jgi:hypothetical protein
MHKLWVVRYAKTSHGNHGQTVIIFLRDGTVGPGLGILEVIPYKRHIQIELARPIADATFAAAGSNAHEQVAMQAQSLRPVDHHEVVADHHRAINRLLIHELREHPVRHVKLAEALQLQGHFIAVKLARLESNPVGTIMAHRITRPALVSIMTVEKRERRPLPSKPAPPGKMAVSFRPIGTFTN